MSAVGDTPLVSIVIPTRDRVDLLPRAIDSVLGQTWPRLEVIVVDDGSTDATPAFVDRLRGSHPHLISLRHDLARGACAARNLGLRTASGSLVATLDDDDAFAPTRIASLVNLLQAQPHLSFVCSDYEVVRRHGRRTSRKPGPITLERLLWTNVASPSFLTSRERLLAIGGFDEALSAAQDHDVCTRLVATYGPAFRLGDVLYTYHQAHGSPRLSAAGRTTLQGHYGYYRAHKHRMSRQQRAWHLYRLMKLRGRRPAAGRFLHMVPAWLYPSELNEYLFEHTSIHAWLPRVPRRTTTPP